MKTQYHGALEVEQYLLGSEARIIIVGRRYHYLDLDGILYDPYEPKELSSAVLIAGLCGRRCHKKRHEMAFFLYRAINNPHYLPHVDLPNPRHVPDDLPRPERRKLVREWITGIMKDQDSALYQLLQPTTQPGGNIHDD